MRIGISYSNRDTKVFGGLIIYSFSVNLNDLNDETPAAITFTGNLNIVGNTAANTNLGTLSATDADAGDTLCVAFKVSGGAVEC
jgi:phosphoenolpyruvate carboxylase